MNSLLLALLALPATPQDWHAAELPSLCVELVPAPSFPPLEDGRHVILDGRERKASPERVPALPASQVRQMLEAEARRQGRALTFYPSAPPLLVHGSADDRAWLNAALSELHQAGERTQVEVAAWLRPVRGASPTGDNLPPPDEAPAGSKAWHGRLPSGAQVAFGRRVREHFLASFEVEVASEEGVAVPQIGQIVAGHTLHLRAARVDAGRSIHLTGVLDLARVRGLEEFDPGTPDLGSVQQPLVDVVQVHFSGVVHSGGFLTVSVSGTPLDQPDWTLWVQAATEPDPDEPPDSGWRMTDLALLAAAPRRLPTWRPHTGPSGRSLPFLTAAALPALENPAVPVSPAGLGSLTGETGRRNPRGVLPSYWTQRLLLVHPEDSERWARTRDLCRTMESARLYTARMELTAGNLQVSLPVAVGVPARVLVGRERTFLVGYEAELAPDISMPSPIVERWFEGLAWQGMLSSRQLQAEVRTTHTESVEIAQRSATVLGDLQLPRRSVRAADLGVTPDGQARVALEADAGSPAVTLRLVAP
jgi:hypothetical protein